MGFKRRDPSKLQNQLEDMTSTGSYDDKDEWKLTLDKAGNGNAIIRFLPSKDDDSTPFVKIYTHGFKEGGQWFIENCPTTLGNQDNKNPCPACEANSELWETGLESNKKIASSRKRSLSYWANILVIKDGKNPDAEGKVFKYRFGSKIMEKIQAKANPPEELGEDPIDVTCVFDGADFFLSTKKVSGYQNYDDSQFKTPKKINGIDDEAYQDELIESMHDLNKIIAPSEFKKYDELKERFEKVTGEKSGSVGNAEQAANKELDDFSDELNQMSNESNESDNSDDVDDLLGDDESNESDKPKEKSKPEDDDDDLDDLLNDI